MQISLFLWKRMSKKLLVVRQSLQPCFAGKVHKTHCKRNLFAICICCCGTNPQVKCDKCPVKFCNEDCKSKLYSGHKEYDCDYFHKTFGENYLDYA